jgi:hypothetical protein
VELAQRLELVGAGRDPGGLAQLRLPRGGGRGVGGQLGPDDIDRLTGRSNARGERTAGGVPGRGYLRPRIRGADSERAAARALHDDPPD